MGIHDRLSSGPTLHAKDCRHFSPEAYAAAVKAILDPRTRLNPTNPPPITYAPVIERPPATVDARTLSPADYAALKNQIAGGYK